MDDISTFKKLRCKFPKNVIISYLNINSIRNKLDSLSCMVGDLVDVLTVAESKLDSSFPNLQFSIPNFKSPYRLDITAQSGGLLTYVRADIPSRLLSFNFPKDIQILPIEINLRKCKWLLLNVYRPPKQNVKYFLDNLSNAIVFFNNYDNIIINGDMNLEPENVDMVDFLELNCLYNHMKHKTCWKSERGSCIDLIISNRKFSIFNTGTFETGLSDHHSLIYCMLKTTFVKLPPKVVNYRNWKNFVDIQFKAELNTLLNKNISNYAEFENIFKSVINRHAPIKTKILRGNNQPHVTKDLRKAIMKRSKLKNIANRTKNPEDIARYRRQRNLVVGMNRQAKKSFFSNHAHTNTSFWKTIKPFFNSKSAPLGERLLIVENEEVISDSSKIASIFNAYFNTIATNLDIPPIPGENIEDLDPLSTATAKYARHPSILKIKSMFHCHNFELKAVTRDTMIKEILSLNPGKKVSGSIPIKALQLSVYECADVLTFCFNDSIIRSSIFPDELKLAEIIPVHKKGDTTDKANYRPISLLPIISKVFERLIAKQIEPFINTIFSKQLSGFRKGFRTEIPLLNMLRDWQNCLNNSGKVGAILMDLSKAFDCLPHDLLLAKMAAYGFGERSLRLFANYLSNRRQRVRIGSSISSILEILLGVPQGSVLGPILFNIFINDLLLSVSESDICNFADDNSLYVCDTSIDNVLRRLKLDLDFVIKWFSSNGMVANPSKFQAIFPGANDKIVIDIGTFSIENSQEVQLLGVTIDSKLTFYSHVKNICKRALGKIKVLMRVRSYLTQKQADLLFNAFIFSNFNYCPLVWMFCSNQSHNLINKTHGRALSAKYNTYSLNFDQLLQRDGSVSIHARNLRLLVTEVFKSLNKLSPEIMWDMFQVKPLSYNLRNGTSLIIPSASSARSLNSFDFRSSLAWNHLPASIKSKPNLSMFIKAINKAKVYCRCKFCSK